MNSTRFLSLIGPICPFLLVTSLCAQMPPEMVTAERTKILAGVKSVPKSGATPVTRFET